MTNTKKLELAARVMYAPWHLEDNRFWLMGVWWLPDDCDGDSRLLEIACLKWLQSHAHCVAVAEAYSAYGDLILCGDLTPESYRAAVLDLAAAIGESMEPSDQINVSFGAFAPSIADQVGVRNADIDAAQISADAIRRLEIAGLLTDSACHAARHKLLQRVNAMVADEQRMVKHETK